MKTRKKQTPAIRLKKKATFMKLGEKLTAVKNYFSRATAKVISIINNVVLRKKKQAVKNPVEKKVARRKPIASTAQKKKIARGKKKTARVNNPNDINIYA